MRYDPVSPAFVADPYPVFERLRRECRGPCFGRFGHLRAVARSGRIERPIVVVRDGVEILRGMSVGARSEGGPQGFVPLDERIETGAQRARIERPLEAHRARDVIGAALGLQIPQEP